MALNENATAFRLHGYWRSSATHRVRIALALKKVAYETTPVNIVKGENNLPLYVAIAPNQYVPCLYIDDEPMVESLPIIELLDELVPEPALLPGSAKDRARIRALSELVNAGIQPLQNLHVGRHLSADETVQKEWALHFMRRGLAAIEAMMAHHEALGVKGPFAYGETPTMADCTFLPQWYASKRRGIDLTPYPRFIRAVEAIAAYPGVDAAAPEKQPDAVVAAQT